MKDALILHGNDDSSKRHWYTWLKTELDREGYTTWSPDLPQANNPNLTRYNDFIFSNKDFQFNEETIIIGHSSGAVAILGLLQALPENALVNSVYLVGSFNQDLHAEGVHHEELFLVPFDFEKIKKKARKFIFVHSDDDPYCPLVQAEDLAQKTKGKLIVLKGQKHFSTTTAGEAYKQFPKLLEIIQKETLK